MRNAIACENQPAARLARQSNSCVCAFDALNAAEKNEWRIVRDSRLEAEKIRVYKVWDSRPMRAPSAPHSGDVLAAAGKLDGAATKFAGDPNLLTTGTPLIRHNLGDSARKQRQ